MNNGTFSSNPILIPNYLGVPTIKGKWDLGASSPANPALHIPDPLSITIADF